MSEAGPTPDTPEGEDVEVRLASLDPSVPESEEEEPSPGTEYLQSFATSEDRSQERATVYWILVAVLFMGASLFRRFPFADNEQRHVIWEFISTTLAFMVGSLSLVRYYSKKQDTFLFIGTGFLGAGALNMYHAVS